MCLNMCLDVCACVFYCIESIIDSCRWIEEHIYQDWKVEKKNLLLIEIKSIFIDENRKQKSREKKLFL